MGWIGLIAGVVLGAAIGKLPGALALGFIGWLVGFIIAAARKPKEAPAAQGIRVDVITRLDAIERRLAAVERQLAVPREALAARPAAAEVALASPAVVVEPPIRGDDVSRTGEYPRPVEPMQGVEAEQPAPALPPPPRPAPPPPPPREPEKPNPIVAWFLGGNTIVRVGLVVLFIGLAFLVKYGVEHQLIPVELRVAAVGAAGLALLIVGWRLRWKNAGYALSMQGAGVAVLYLTIFGALKLYHLIPAPAAFFLLVFVAALGSFLAVRQDSLAFAVFAAAGGFLAPILASTGQGSHVLLFSYYLLLNASIVGIAWFKAWRALNAVGFIFTALIGLAWGVRSYRPELFDTTEPFLVAFFLMYVAIAILFARKATDMTTNQAAVDASIVFGNPIFAFGLQAGIVKGMEFGLAFSSVAAAAVYLVLASFLRPRDATTSRASDSRYALLFECFLALGVVFATLAIPLALDARWTSAAWAIEGAALVWVGLRQNRKLARAFGMLLELGAGISFFLGYTRMPPGPPLADAVFVGSMVMAIAGLITWRLLAGPRANTEPEKAGAPFVFLWSMGWLIVAGGHEIETFVPSQYRAAAWIAFATTIALAFGIAHIRWQWREAQWPAWMLPPVLLVLAAIVVVERIHPFGDFRWLAWIYAIAANYYLLARVDLEKEWKGTAVLHVISVALVALVGSVELEWIAAENTAPGTAWSLAARLVIPSLIVFWISARAMDTRWPVRDHARAYRIGAVGVLFAAMALWSLHVNLSHAGGSEPLPYFPVLNALDLAHILGILAAVTAIRAARRSDLEAPDWFTTKLAWTVVGVLGFIWANSMLLRTIHHWAGISYHPYSLWHSVLVQAALSVFWAFLALSLMVYATRTLRRPLWLIGATLMGIVILKLVTVDLSHLSGIERIVSFIGVGVLMLVIGYFSPVPPRTKEAV